MGDPKRRKQSDPMFGSSGNPGEKEQERGLKHFLGEGAITRCNKDRFPTHNHVRYR